MGSHHLLSQPETLRLPSPGSTCPASSNPPVAPLPTAATDGTRRNRGAAHRPQPRGEPPALEPHDPMRWATACHCAHTAERVGSHLPSVLTLQALTICTAISASLAGIPPAWGSSTRGHSAVIATSQGHRHLPEAFTLASKHWAGQAHSLGCQTQTSGWALGAKPPGAVSRPAGQRVYIEGNPRGAGQENHETSEPSELRKQDGFATVKIHHACCIYWWPASTHSTF